MDRNTILLKRDVTLAIDRAKNARFEDWHYIDAINRAIRRIIKDRYDNIKKARPQYYFQTAQRVIDELQTIVKRATNNNALQINIPTDYIFAALVYGTKNNKDNYSKFIPYSEFINLQVNPFYDCSIEQPLHYLEAGVIKLLTKDTVVYDVVNLIYIKKPLVVSIGKESQKIEPGNNLVATTTYMVYEDAEHNGTKYYEGETFVAANTTLTSGIVIPNSVIVNTDMPGILHDEIVTIASAYLMGTIEDYNKSQLYELENQKS